MAEDIRKNTILIVDDESSALKLIKMILEDLYDLVLVTSVEEAIDSFNNKKPDLVFTDINLPGASGFELVEFVKDELGSSSTIKTFIKTFSK